MFRQASFWFVLLSAASTMVAQTFRLGVDFSQPIGERSLFVTNLAVATDAQGGIYGLASNSTKTSQSHLVKLTPAGAVVYQTTLPFFAPVMAVDTAGNVYLAVENREYVQLFRGEVGNRRRHGRLSNSDWRADANRYRR